MAIAILTLAAALLSVANAAVVPYNFNVGWVTANPDGAFDRRTIGINGQWPLPQIRGNIGDNIIVNVQNNLDEITSLHFHGIFMNGTTYMDGPVGTTQCPIPPGGSFTYNFTVIISAQKGLYMRRELTLDRSTNRAPTGIIVILGGSTPMASGDRSLSTTQITPSRISTTKSLS